MGKRIVKQMMLVLLLMAVLATGMHASAEMVITVDENGLASWQPVEGAVSYRCAIVDGTYTYVAEFETTETFAQLMEGFSLHVQPVFANGEHGNWNISDYFGEPAMPVIGNNAAPDGNGSLDGEYVEPVSEIAAIPEVFMDDSGLVTWEPVEGAYAYQVEIGYDFISAKKVITDQTSYQCPEGFRLSIMPLLPDGNGVITMSDYFGEPRRLEAALDTTGMDVYDFVAAIDASSFKQNENGTVTFTATGPDGQPMRFVGTDISLEEGGVRFAPAGTLYALDAIGTIYAAEPQFSDNGDTENAFAFQGGYEPFGRRSVDDTAALMLADGFGFYTRDAEGSMVAQDALCPNFIGFAANRYNVDDFVLSSLKVYYTTDSYHTGVKEVGLYADFYGTYMEGDPYDPSREGRFSLAENEFTFYLLTAMDTPKGMLGDDSTLFNHGVDKPFFTVGNLKDAQGNVLDKATATVEKGMVLEVTIGGKTYDVELPVIGYYRNARTLHELIPHGTLSSVGEQNVLVIPIAWQDDPHTKDDDAMQSFKAELGRVADMTGAVTDHSDALMAKERFSLSRYFDQASYGKLKLTSYMTDWYPAPYTFEQMSTRSADEFFMQEMLDWLFAAYPDMDWSRFDQDGNGYFDSVILLNAGDNSAADGFNIISFAGGVRFMNAYTDENAGTPFRPAVNDYILVHADRFDDNVIVHEFGHTLGLVDYYDVTYSGINAVGQYDMQSTNHGDWNAYSKYAVGWIEPTIVTGLKPGESTEITLGAMSVTGDAIVIPAAGAQQDGTPFNEYVLVDLFTDEGLHQWDAKKYGLGDAVGVRIYHVNAVMERRELTHQLAGDTTYPIGTIHVGNDYKGDDKGEYLIELIQRGGDNTFTDKQNLRTTVGPKDLFKAGDEFTAEKYNEFFLNGMMDDGQPFGYTIKIVSIGKNANGEQEAVIRITRK